MTPPLPDRDLAPLGAETLMLTERWCAIPSVSGNDSALAAMANELVDWLENSLHAEIVRTALDTSPPIVHARIDAGREHTLILYNMYDVMPADRTGWMVAPFEGAVITLPGIGPAFVARGAENNKGPLAGMLVALKALLRDDALPVNVEILIEGEEECGSRALRAYLADPDCPLEPACTALFPSFCEYGGGPPRLYLGFSGIARGEIRTAGGAWGGPRQAIHSSNSPWIANPALRLIEAIAAIAEMPTGRVDRITLDREAETLIAALARDFDLEAELAFRHSSRFAREGTARALLETLLTTASLNIARLSTEPPMGSAIIPHASQAGFDLRTPPGIDPVERVERARQRLADTALEGVAIELHDVYPGHRFGPSAIGVPELMAIYAAHGSPPQVWPWAPGAAPAYAFAPYSEAFLIGGLGRGGNAHGINEFMALDGLERFLGSLLGWLSTVGTDLTESTQPEDPVR